MDVVRFDSVSRRFLLPGTTDAKSLLLGRRQKRCQDVWAVRELSFRVQSGDSIAILGHNGSGKSTTLKLIAGTLQPSSGTIRTRGRIAPLLQLGSGFHPELTGRENIFLNGAIIGLPRSYLKRHLEEIIDFSGLGRQIDSPVRSYSSGMYTRLGFSIAVHVQPEILLVDEVLAVGDGEFQRKSLNKMLSLRDEGRAMILVTHSVDVAKSFCARAIVLHHGSLIFDGPSSDAEASVVRSVRTSTEDQ